MMEKLFVYYEDINVGTLERDAELTYSFEYSDAWLSKEDHFPLSLALTLEKKKFGNKATLSFFENLLPEGEVRSTLEKNQDVHGIFEFLSHYGQDCAGAVVVTKDKNYVHHMDQRQIAEVDMEKVYKAIEDRRSVTDVMADTSPGYLSLAGAQDKFPAIYKNGKFYLPLKGAPTTHIVKVPIWRYEIKDSVYNEYFCMELAREIGLNVPHCFVHKGKAPLFVVERYDRYLGKDKLIHRLHQQDFCQALGITSEFKYEEKGGPGLRENYELILENVSIKKRIESIHTFLDWICFNLLIGNNDSHSKNISLLMQDGKYELAPLYDLLSTAIYPKLKRNFSFKIGDRDDFSRIGRNQFELLENELGLKRGTCLERLQAVNDLVMAVKDDLAKRILKEHPGVKIIPRLNDMLESRSKSLRMQRAIE